MNDSIGIRIKTIRKSNKMTQIQFSSILGISQGRLSEIEKNITKPSMDTLVALRKHFEVDLNKLLDENDEKYFFE